MLRPTTQTSLRPSGSFYEEVLHRDGEEPEPTGRVLRRALPGEPHDASVLDPLDFVTIRLRFLDR